MDIEEAIQMAIAYETRIQKTCVLSTLNAGLQPKVSEKNTPLLFALLNFVDSVIRLV